MYKCGLLPLSADPIHKGHIALINEAKQQCNELLVCISDNDQKKGSYLFSKKERMQFASQAIEGKQGIKIISGDKILADIYLENNCDALFRGIRNKQDHEYEMSQMVYHKLILNRINPVYLNLFVYNKISSSMIKAFVSHYIDVQDYVIIPVKRALEEKINKQYKIAITGGIATGKSYVCKQLLDYLNQHRHYYYENGKYQTYLTKIISFDKLIHQVYEDMLPGFQQLRNQINDLCSSHGCKSSILKEDGQIDRKILGNFIFNESSNPYLKEKIQYLTQPYVDAKYREELKDFEGIVLIEWAQLAEMNMGNIANHNVIVVHSPDREKFLDQRKISSEKFANIDKNQFSLEERIKSLQYSAQRDGGGNIIEYSNSIKNNKIDYLGEEIINLFDLNKDFL